MPLLLTSQIICKDIRGSIGKRFCKQQSTLQIYGVQVKKERQRWINLWHRSWLQFCVYFQGSFLISKLLGWNGVWEELWMSPNPFPKSSLWYNILSPLNNCILRLTCLINFFTPGSDIFLISLGSNIPSFTYTLGAKLPLCRLLK